MDTIVIRQRPSMAQMLGASVALGAALGWGPYGGGIRWRGVRGHMAKHRLRRKTRNRMARESRRRNRK